MSKYLSYAQFVKDRQLFKRAGTNSGDAFNIYDNPSHKYFKILFYFGSNADKEANLTSSTNIGNSSGLLAPTWDIFDTSFDKTDYYNYNSAWAYLKMNDENERAAMLEQFVTLLSNINTYSPWYFQTIGGLSEALERKVIEDGKFEIGDAKKLTITCLPDAFDNRIGTLLELYRSIVWSWVQKKEIVPANLRKFDMAVYIFESPIANWHKDDDNDYDSLDGSGRTPSYKMIEFHDCEFNYNSLKSGYSELNNQEGFSPSYTIEISYNDCYEVSYNEFVFKTLGDVIATDTYQSLIRDRIAIDNKLESVVPVVSPAEKQSLEALKRPVAPTETDIPYNINTTITYGNLEDNNRTGVSTRKDKVEFEQGFLSNAIGQVAGHLTADVKSVFKRKLLGNIHTYSLTQIRDQASDLIKGNVIKTGMTVAEYIKSGQQRAAMKNKRTASGNIFPITANATKHKPSGDLFPEPERTNKKPYGNIFN